MIELLIFLIVIVGFFVFAGWVGDSKLKLTQREEQERIREAIRKHAVRNISGNWMWEGNRHG